MGREIHVTITKTGDTQIETKGFVGTDCVKETADIERALGAKTKDVPTREAHASQTNSATAKAGR